MVPHTYPSQLNSTTGQREMIVHLLSSVSGLNRWEDYIPIKFHSDDFPTEGTTDNNGFIAVAYLSDITGLVPYGDYVPVYVDQSATDAWAVDSVGYIPVEHSGRSTHRDILTLNGIDIDGVFNTPLVLATNDTVDTWLSTPSSGVLMDVFDGVMQFDAGDLLQLTNCTATFDGVAVADGASIAAYLDGKLHNIVLTMTGSDTITYLGSNGASANYFSGEVLSVKATISSVVTNYIIDSGSTTIQYARGEVSPSAKYLTLNNVADTDWESFTYNQQYVRWEGVDRVVNGGFDTDTDWTKGTGWTIAAGVASCDGTQVSASNLSQDISAHVNEGERVSITYTVNSISVDWIRIVVGGTTGGTTVQTAPGTYTDTINAGSGTPTGIRVNAGTICEADNISARKVLEYT